MSNDNKWITNSLLQIELNFNVRITNIYINAVT